MTSTSGRLLQLLSLLQARRDWPGAVLADDSVSPPHGPHDVNVLRELGYPIDGSPGVAGGYRLGAGAELPPLLLDDEEAVAVAIGLRTAAGGDVIGIEESALRAVGKLDRVLPPRLRRRVNAVVDATSSIRSPGVLVDPATLVAISAAVRDREVLRFDYRKHDGSAGRRTAEPIASFMRARTGTSSAGTSTAATGGRTGSTGCRSRCPTVRASKFASRRMAGSTGSWSADCRSTAGRSSGDFC